MNNKGAIFTGTVLIGLLGALFAGLAIPIGYNADKKAHQDSVDSIYMPITPYTIKKENPCNSTTPIPEPGFITILGLLGTGLVLLTRKEGINVE